MPKKIIKEFLRKRRRKRERSALTLKPLGGMPKSKTVRLRYVQEFSLNGGAGGAAAVQHFRANCLRDPDNTGVGHQPKHYDQLMAFYSHFTVVGSKITVKEVCASTTNQQPYAWGICLDRDVSTTVTGDSIQDILENVQGQNKAYRIGGIQAHENTTLSKSFSARKYFGVKNIVGKSMYKGDNSNSPDEQAHFAVWCAGTNGQDAGAAAFICIIDYIAVLTEPIDVIGS